MCVTPLHLYFRKITLSRLRNSDWKKQGWKQDEFEAIAIVQTNVSVYLSQKVGNPLSGILFSSSWCASCTDCMGLGGGCHMVYIMLGNFCSSCWEEGGICLLPVGERKESCLLLLDCWNMDCASLWQVDISRYLLKSQVVASLSKRPPFVYCSDKQGKKSPFTLIRAKASSICSRDTVGQLIWQRWSVLVNFFFFPLGSQNSNQHDIGVCWR